MNLFLKLIFGFLIFTFDLSAIFNRGQNSASLVGRGNCGNANFAIENILLNPASSKIQYDFKTDFFISNGLFDLKELNYKGISLNKNFDDYNLQFSLLNFGDAKYNELSSIINLSKSFNEKYFIGLNFILNSLKIENYGNANSISNDFGFIYKFNENFNFGFSFSNIFNSTIGESRIPIPQVYSIGINYSLDNNSFLEWNLESSDEIKNKIGVEYELLHFLKIRSGVETNPQTEYFGFTIKNNFCEIDYSISINNYLGNTNTYSIKIYFE